MEEREVGIKVGVEREREKIREEKNNKEIHEQIEANNNDQKIFEKSSLTTSDNKTGNKAFFQLVVIILIIGLIINFIIKIFGSD